MRAALAIVASGAAGCNVLFGFQDIVPVGDAGGDAGSRGPNAFSSPGPHDHSKGYDYVQPVSVTLASGDPGATIYYTLDGMRPSSSSPHGATPVTGIEISTNATLAYYASSGQGDGAIAQDAYYITAAKQSNGGYQVTDVVLDGSSPVVVVTPGQTLSGATAHVQIWVGTTCMVCSAQLVYGVDTMDQGCLFDSQRDDPTGPSLFPGFTRTATFDVTAPMTRGIHEIRVANTLQTSCADAMGMNTLLNRPDVSRIGVLIVQ